MEERLDLRQFQARLAERLKDTSRPEGGAKLGFLAGGRHWLVALDQVSEVVAVPALARAPWTRPWFLGVAGVRGTLYGCTDLAAYLDLAPARTPEEVRLLLAHARFGAHAAFRIDQALGLRNSAGMTAVERAGTEPAWLLARFTDADGVDWSELSLENLVAEPRFLRVA